MEQKGTSMIVMDFGKISEDVLGGPKASEAFGGRVGEMGGWEGSEKDRK